MCASLLLRRSGIAVGLICSDILRWRPDAIYQVGVGFHHDEVASFREDTIVLQTVTGVDGLRKEKVLKKAWPDVEFIGCEPHPKIAAGLREEYPGTIHEVAIGDRVGRQQLSFRPKHKDGSSLCKRVDGVQSVFVDVTTLDKLFPDLLEDRQILLWLDCEGSELKVLRGAPCFVQHVQVINIELTSAVPYTGWCKPEDVHRWLAEQGFWLQWIHTQRSASGQCDFVYVRELLFKPERCCVPHERIRWENR